MTEADAKALRYQLLREHMRGAFYQVLQCPRNFAPYLAEDVVPDLEFSEADLRPALDGYTELVADTALVGFPRRLNSALGFGVEPNLSTADFHAFLLNAYCATDTRGSRPYPSAGALYPVRVFLALLNSSNDEDRSRVEGCEAGLYCLLPATRRLQSWKKCGTSEIFDHWNLRGTHQLENAAFAVAYVLDLEQATFKYRARGYRHGLIEAGAMAQQADLVALQLGLRNRIHSSFCDSQLTAHLELRATEFLPICVQWFGFDE